MKRPISTIGLGLDEVRLLCQRLQDMVNMLDFKIRLFQEASGQLAGIELEAGKINLL